MIASMMKIYLVGGAVRDRLLKIPVEERDYVVVGATPEEMVAQGFRPVGKEFPVFIDPKTGSEYALARTEKKIGKGYKGFKFYAAPEVTLEEDLKRRDLTINAIAEDEQGNIIDPHNGQQDLKDKILRHVSPAFAEDPVRILRVARFAARHCGFSIHRETQQLMAQMVQAGEVDALVPERVWQEFAKALQEECSERFLQVLQDTGALNILFPELTPVYEAAHEALKKAAFFTYAAQVRFAALFSQVTPDDTKKLCERLRVPSDYKNLALLVAKYYSDFSKVLSASAEEILDLLEKVDAFRRPERFGEFACACSVNAAPTRAYGKLFDAYKTAAAISHQELIDKGISGKAINEELHKLRLAAIKKEKL